MLAQATSLTGHFQTDDYIHAEESSRRGVTVFRFGEFRKKERSSRPP
jgi:hypothetical protein